MVSESERIDMAQSLAEITEKEEAILVYAESIVDLEDAEGRLTANVTKLCKHDSDEYVDIKTYMKMLEHATKELRREGEEDVQAIKTYMTMLEHKCGADIRTAARNMHNDWMKCERIIVPQDEA